jgi:aldehyde:ferredoxin oxidoreductase
VYGWTGKILDVDLSTGMISEIETRKYSRKYLGGRGMASRIYWERVAPQTGVFDSQNHLILMTGPLVATGAQGATRMSIAGKSPMTYPEQYCYGNLGGLFPAELKKAGWDGIIITGQAPVPQYLWIEDNQVELRDGDCLRDLNTFDTADKILKIHGKTTRFLTTGISGKNLVRSAVLFGSHNSTSTAGFGAVMASKNLMVIAVKGGGRPVVANSEKIKELNRLTVRLSKRLDLSIPPDITMSHHGHLLERMGRGGCYQCTLDCIRNRYRYGQREELVANRRCQAMEYYLPWSYGQNKEPIDTLFRAPDIANDWGICTFELRNIINWLYACYSDGILTESGTGLPLSGIGTRDFLEKLLKTISLREGIGDILAEGLVRAVERFSAEAKAKLDPMVHPVGELDANMPRSKPVHAILDTMEPRMNRPLVHAGFARTAWLFNHLKPGSNPITPGVFREIARIFWGSKEAADFSSYEGKALAAIKIQNRNYMEDCLGLCDFAYPLAYSFSKPDGVGDPDLEARYFKAVTGMDEKEIDMSIERAVNIQRAIQLREGRKVPEDDFPPEVNFTTPINTGGRLIVPGPGDEPVDMTGAILDRDKFIGMLREYYCLRGWNENSGKPMIDTLSALELEDISETIITEEKVNAL